MSSVLRESALFEEIGEEKALRGPDGEGAAPSARAP